MTAPPPNEPPPSAGPPPPPLADTGAGDPTAPAGLAAVMALLGAALMVFSRRLARR
ncbi:NPXTG-anchored protein [Occultella aeris]|uniref:Uncharacterized protein n=1 Tax=Occultella aeris TaxID=2761496 RepID=A0A7M4DJY4_9MICO|nr:NPXTG-anchored protein [Occultella aeris]VZO37371.1 hypothetical protein HALOF300_02446 [Occultella aeris]